MAELKVCIESTPKRSFAVALGWPGWARSAKSEDAAIVELVEYADRYAAVVREAGLRPASLSVSAVTVVERLPGNATTEFGAPGAIARADYEPLTAAEADREARLVSAAWRILDEVAAGSPESLRKGPRGGGRDRGPMIEHVMAAEAAYARKLGVRLPEPSIGTAGVAALRAAVIEVLSKPSDGSPAGGGSWPPRYGARRIAWHVLDHAWEMADRSTP